MDRKIIFRSIIIVAVIAVAALLYGRFASRTVVTTLNFPDFTVEKFIRSNNNGSVKIVPADMDKPERILRSDMVLVRIHGNTLDARHFGIIQKAIEKGIPVYSTDTAETSLNSLKGEALEYIHTLMENGSVQNYRSLFNYIRKEIDRKPVFNKEYGEPVIVPKEYYFHLGDDMFFKTYEDYDKFYRESGKYKEGAPRVAILSGNINLQNSNEEHIAALINSLEAKGLNVYPINSFGPGKLKMISATKPDLIINRPHGRLVMGMGEAGTELLKKLDVPVLSPVTVSEEHDKWFSSKQGMAAGGMASMSIVLPELDGAIAPYAIAAQFNRNGMLLFDAIPGHTEKFCRLADKYARLHATARADKKIAIYYYKGTGKGSVSSADLEGVQSLYNTLKLLKDNGYDVSGLPASAGELEKMIQKQGSVLGPYAEGAYDEFLKTGNPELVDMDTFMSWAEEELPAELIGQLGNKYGEFPGKYMNAYNGSSECIAVARITFGNVVILPQPLPSAGENIDKIIHGTDGAPAYPYVASYLWTRKGFGADAIIHFGTHGSLEFIPGKQVALSDYDWTDALIGDIPHFYIYTINNIGEGIIAKRRSYAALVSHLTSPFMQSGLYSDLTKLKDRIHRMEVLEEGEVKENYRESITELAVGLSIHKTLDLDSAKTFNDADIERIHHYIEEIDGAKVRDGLYTLGKPYTDKEADNTARLISSDPVRYALASADVSTGKIKEKDLDDLVFMAHNYNATTEKIISDALRGIPAEQIINKYCPDKAGDSRLKEAISDVSRIRKDLVYSTTAEQQSLLNALDGGYIHPSSAGDAIGNPQAIPTGKNFYSINPETTPSEEAWKVGKRLAEDLLAAEMRDKGKYPEKVSFTLWATDFISSEGATVAQILYLLGVEPVRDGFGYIRSLKLIPSEQLGRPRIDVVVQTSGQLRDIAASRLALINQAVRMAAEDKSEDNYVSKGLKDSEKVLLEKGFSPSDARKYASERVFGGTGGRYGTGIMGKVEKGDSWESRDEIASEYISNMSAIYSGNGDETWGAEIQGVFEAALQNTSVVVQPRSSNTWGPLSLDHVYEFMGGISAAVEKVTGSSPTGYFNDFRNSSRAKVQGLKEAIGVETSSTLFNPKYISEMLEGEASAMDHFAETFRNTYGWNAMKPDAIDKHIWDNYYDVYVNDKYNLDIAETFQKKNPYALQEMTAVMLESARKGMWKASAEQIRTLADMHAELVRDYTAGCSGFICDNAKLREFISGNTDEALRGQYTKAISQAREVQIETKAENVVLKKEDQAKRQDNRRETAGKEDRSHTTLYIIAAIILACSVWIIVRNRKK